MEPKTREELLQEITDLRALNENVAKLGLEHSQVIGLLVAAGFVTQKKVDEARALLKKL